MSDVFHVYELGIAREAFPDEETYRKAVETSTRRREIPAFATENIAGIDKAELLAALYNAAEPTGMGLLQARGDMTVEEARALLIGSSAFDYLYGRPLKIDLSGDTMQTDLYDRYIAPGTARTIIAQLRANS